MKPVAAKASIFTRSRRDSSRIGAWKASAPCVASDAGARPDDEPGKPEAGFESLGAPRRKFLESDGFTSVSRSRLLSQGQFIRESRCKKNYQIANTANLATKMVNRRLTRVAGRLCAVSAGSHRHKRARNTSRKAARVGSNRTRLQRRRSDSLPLGPRPAAATLHRRDNLNHLRHGIGVGDSPRTSPNKSPAQGSRRRTRTAAFCRETKSRHCV